MLLLSFAIGDCDNAGNGGLELDDGGNGDEQDEDNVDDGDEHDYDGNDARLTLKRGQNSYLKNNRDKLYIQEKLRKSQVVEKV